MSDELELVLAYVPESEYLSFDDALALAHERDEQMADRLIISCEAAGLESRH